MADRPTDPIIPSFGQGKNVHSTFPTRAFEVGDSSQLRPKREISYTQIQVIHPITRQFTKVGRLIDRVISLPYSPKKNKTTSTWIVVSSVEYMVLSTLEELANSMEKEEEPPLFNGGNRGNILLSGANFSRTGREEEGEDELSDSNKEEEDNEEEDKANQNLDWMNQGPLALPTLLHKMPRHLKKILMKYDPYKRVKDEDHLDNFYLHLQTLEVCYNDVACRHFPCTLDGRLVVPGKI